MSEVFKTIQERYQKLVARKEKGETGEDFLEDVSGFIADAQRAGAAVADLNERSQLRAWMRFLAAILYDATGVHPDVTLQPLARGQLVSPRPERKREQTLPPLGWALVGAAVLVIIAGLFLMANWLPSPATPTTPSASVPPTPVGNVEVGLGQSSTGGLALQAQVFCVGTAEIMAQFIVPAPLLADAQWGWKLTRAGRTIAMESPLVWETGSTSRAMPVALPDSSPLAAGRYELTFLIGDQPVANHIFEVLAEEPQVSNLQVSDVPTRTGRTEFESGIRVIYATYDYENLCPGMSITRTVHLDGEIVHESSEAWSGVSNGSGQLEYYKPGRLPLPSGEYTVAVGVGEGEPRQVPFAIDGAMVPAFGEITIALGVQPDGEPILQATEDTPFGSSTRMVYAIFKYTGMSDGLAWEAMWTRNGEEVHRSGEQFWSAEAAATEDTHWVAYYRQDGEPLGGGNYSVTLYIDGDPQKTADFRIYYPLE